MTYPNISTMGIGEETNKKHVCYTEMKPERKRTNTKHTLTHTHTHVTQYHTHTHISYAMPMILYTCPFIPFYQTVNMQGKRKKKKAQPKTFYLLLYFSDPNVRYLLSHKVFIFIYSCCNVFVLLILFVRISHESLLL
jgi:hypothetical protein